MYSHLRLHSLLNLSVHYSAHIVYASNWTYFVSMASLLPWHSLFLYIHYSSLSPYILSLSLDLSSMYWCCCPLHSNRSHYLPSPPAAWFDLNRYSYLLLFPLLGSVRFELLHSMFHYSRLALPLPYRFLTSIPLRSDSFGLRHSIHRYHNHYLHPRLR